MLNILAGGTGGISNRPAGEPCGRQSGFLGGGSGTVPSACRFRNAKIAEMRRITFKISKNPGKRTKDVAKAVQA